MTPDELKAHLEAASRRKDRHPDPISRRGWMVTVDQLLDELIPHLPKEPADAPRP